MASTYVLCPLIQYVGMSYNFGMVVGDWSQREVGQRSEIRSEEWRSSQGQRMKINIEEYTIEQNNQIDLYQRIHRV